MKFELKEHYWNVPEEEMINDVIAVSKKLGKNSVTHREYALYGKFHPSSLRYRFKSWYVVLERAGLQPTRWQARPKEEILLENIGEVWMKLGRQPTYQIMKLPLSKYDGRTYRTRFGTWMNALRKFVEYKNAGSPGSARIKKKKNSTRKITGKENKPPEGTSRFIPLKLRFSVFLRDGFRCVSCGSSPLLHSGVELHCDHIIPWSKGGKTKIDNLKTLCSDCNLGKGNMMETQ